MNKIIPLLKKFNFTESEAKVYIALLQHGSGTGYEISKNASIARSKIYSILEGLIDKGLIFVSKQTNPLNYSAISIKEFIANIKLEVNDDLKAIQNELTEYTHTTDSEKLWYLRGYKNIINKCKHVLHSAKKEIYIQIWKEEADLLLKELQNAQEKLDRVVVILYSHSQDYDLDLKYFYRHGLEKEKLKESGGRWINIVTDSKELVFGTIQNEKNAEIIWTHNVPMIFLAKENTNHDAYCLKLIDYLQSTSQEASAPQLKDLKNIFKYQGNCKTGE